MHLNIRMKSLVVWEREGQGQGTNKQFHLILMMSSSIVTVHHCSRGDDDDDDGSIWC